MRVLDYRRVCWNKNEVCFGIQIHLMEYKCVCWNTIACVGIQIHVLEYRCVCWRTDECCWIQTHMLEYNYMCWKTDASARIQLRMQKYKCMCWNISSLTKHAYASVDCHNMAALEDIFFYSSYFTFRYSLKVRDICNSNLDISN